MNGLTHGLCARSVIIGKESEEAFNTMLEEHLAWFSPRDGVERAVIEEMVAAKWRQLRALEIEDEWLEQELDTQESSIERARIAGAFGTLADKARIALIGRYETRMYRMYHRSMRALLLLTQLRNCRANPSPNPEDTLAVVPPVDSTDLK